MTKNNKATEEKREAKASRREIRDKKKNKPVEIKGLLRAMPVILFAVALFVALCFLTAQTGAFGNFISECLKGLFSYMAYTIPFLILINAIFFYDNAKRRKLFSSFVLSLIALITLSEVAYLITNFSVEPQFSPSLLYNDGIASKGGGFIGGLFGFVLTKLVGKVGLIVIIAMTVALYVLYFIYGGKNGLSRFVLEKLGKIADFGAAIEKRSQEKKRKRKEARMESKRASDDKKHADFYNDNYFHTDNGIKVLEIPELGIREQKDDAANAYVLRESVIKNPANAQNPSTDEETSSAPSATEQQKKPEPEFTRVTETPAGFRADDIIYEASEPQVATAEEPTPTEVKKETIRDFGLDDSADAIFTAEFDPFDIALNEKRAAKQSSKAAELQNENAGFSEFISDMTPEQEAQRRRMEQFERSRREALRRRAEAEAAAREAQSAERSNPAEIANAANTDAEQGSPTQAFSYESATESYEAGASVESPSADHAESAATYSANDESVPKIRESDTANATSSYGYQPSAEASSVNPIAEEKTPANAPYQSQYRFAREVAEEVRRPYASSESAQTAEPHQPARASETHTTSYTYSNYTASNESYINVPIKEERTEQTYEAATETEESTAAEAEPSSAPQEQTFTPYSPTVSANVDFSTEDSPVTERSGSYASAEFIFEKKDGEPSTIEVSRSMLTPDLETPDLKDDNATDTEPMLEEEKEQYAKPEPTLSGLDFSEEEPEDDEISAPDEAYAEEVVERNEIPREEWNPKLSEYRSMFTALDDSGASFNKKDEPLPQPPIAEEPSDDEENEEAYGYDAQQDGEPTSDNGDYDDNSYNEDDYSENDDGEDDEPPFDEPSVVNPVFSPASEPKKEEKPKPPVPDFSNYKFPSLELLKKVEVEDADSINDEIQYGADQLLNTLESFNIKATMKGMERGPRITRYSIVPAKGIRVSQIEKLSDDIALAMAAESIRIEAPIPGKSAVGIEVPNKVPSVVSLRELLESSEFVNEKSKTTVCIGKSVEGMNVFGDIGNMPHLLIAGATGMGKSVCMNSLITSILYKARPDEVKFIMIDPKKVEFAPYNGIPHLLVPVVTDPKQAAGALLWAVDEMNKRYDIIEKLCVRNIDSYNEKVSQNPELGAPMTKIVILIDELNDLMIQVRDPVENLIMLIAQKARAAGIHLVIGTQRPSVNVITGVIKANIPSRIACKVSSGIDSRTILEQTGAEKLIGKGDMLFAPSGKAIKRVQGAYVSESETASIVDFIKAQSNGAIYDEQAMEDMKRAAQKCDKKKGDDDSDDDDRGSELGFLHDRKFLQAVELAIRNGSVATSFLQRRLSIGYGKAAKYIDGMEDLGLIEEKNGSKARNVLISMEEWNEKLARLTSD